MSDISAIAVAMTALSQSRTLDQISMSILKMNAKADQAVADMLLENARQIQSLSDTSGSAIIDLFV
jgi:endonuclease/exonuclease/phosphatase (EEP) superfamily protein YafD